MYDNKMQILWMDAMAADLHCQQYFHLILHRLKIGHWFLSTRQIPWSPTNSIKMGKVLTKMNPVRQRTTIIKAKEIIVNNFRPNISTKWAMWREPIKIETAENIEDTNGLKNVPIFSNMRTAELMIGKLAVNCVKVNKVMPKPNPLNAFQLPTNEYQIIQ